MPLGRIHAQPSCTVPMRPACATVPMAHCCAASRPTATAAAHGARRRGMDAWRRGDFTDAGGGRLRARLGRRGGDTAWRHGSEREVIAATEERWVRPARREDTVAQRTYPSGGGEGDGGVAHSDTRGWKQSGGGFGHGCRAAREARLAAGPSGRGRQRSGRRHDTVRTAPSWRGARVGADAW
jgi:hypothetical protein